MGEIDMIQSALILLLIMAVTALGLVVLVNRQPLVGVQYMHAGTEPISLKIQEHVKGQLEGASFLFCEMDAEEDWPPKEPPKKTALEEYVNGVNAHRRAGNKK
jgi:hypothetical protein